MPSIFEALIPISMFAGLTLVVCLYFWFRYRGRQDMQETIRLAIDKGHELTPEIIDRIGQPKPPKERDLRIALIWLALALGLVLCGVAVPDHSGQAMRGLMAAAAFPFSLGIAFLIMWRYTSSRD